MGYWRMIYDMLGLHYTSKNDHCPHQKHLKYLCCQELNRTNVQNLLTRIMTRRHRNVIQYDRFASQYDWKV